MAETGHDTTDAGGTAAPAGWYPDPWTPDHHRYWTGEAWSASVFPSGPAPPAGDDTRTVSTRPVSQGVVWLSDEEPTVPVAVPPAAPENKGWLPTGRALVVLGLVAGLVFGFSIAFAVTRLRGRTSPPKPVAQPAPQTVPATTQPPSLPADPAASALAGLVVRQADVPQGVTVQLITGGNEVSGQPTLDLCNATFPSEALRTARLQVAVTDGQANDVLSTEAVLYQDAGATAQGFTELRGAAASCQTPFNPAPDVAWPKVATVERLAFDFSSTDLSGQAQRNVAVYLRRGRALMGLYFYAPDGAQLAVAGQTTIPAIVNVFATRMAQLPSSIVG